MKNTILIATLAALAFASPVLAADESYSSTTKVDKDSNGDMTAKSQTESTDAAGTTTTDAKKVDVDVHNNGTTDKTVTTEKSVDPKGLMNKKTVKTKSTSKTKKDGSVQTSHKTTVNGKTVESDSSVSQ